MLLGSQSPSNDFLLYFDCYVIYYFLDIDEKLDKRDLYMVKISDPGAGEEYGIEDIPTLVYFEDGVPEIFTGYHFYFCVLYIHDS
jgi:hypothetical protein